MRMLFRELWLPKLLYPSLGWMSILSHGSLKANQEADRLPNREISSALDFVRDHLPPRDQYCMTLV